MRNKLEQSEYLKDDQVFPIEEDLFYDENKIHQKR